MYTENQERVVEDIYSRLQIENASTDDIKISIRMDDIEVSIKSIIEDPIDITYMFTNYDLNIIRNELPIDIAIRNIAITCVYFYGNPFPLCIEDVFWNQYIDKFNYDK